jgi:hypothetical protein
VTRVPDAAVRSRTDEVAEGSQELQEDCGWIGLGMWRESSDDQTGSTMEGRSG